MKNKNILYILSLLIIIVSSACGKPPEVAMLVQVLDETGHSIEGVEVVGRFYWPEDRLVPAPTGVTDENGEFILRGNPIQRVTAEARKVGYYPSKKSTTVPYPGSKQQPYSGRRADFKVTLTLREIRDPVPMYVRRASFPVPEYGMPIGFDLAENDLIPPHGNGKHADLYFQIDGYFEDQGDSETTLTISFPNEGDGIMVYEADHDSELESPHLAPDDGYQAIIRQTYGIRREDGQRSPQRYGSRVIGEVLLFRIRTELDSDGDVQSANFGKIYGGIEFLGAGRRSFADGKAAVNFRTIYLNPDRESRSLEFDVTENLVEFDGPEWRRRDGNIKP